MPKYQMIAPKLPHMPWQEKPAGHINSPLWRYKDNPIIDRTPPARGGPHLQFRRDAL